MNYKKMSDEDRLKYGPPRDPYGRIYGVAYGNEGTPLASQKALDHQSVWTNANKPMQEPKSRGEIITCMSKDPAMSIEIWDDYIRRTHRSHKPYGQHADLRFKDTFINAWRTNTNDTYTKICSDIAGQV